MHIHNPYANEGKGENAWFKFNQEGIMEYGWIRSENQNWYYCHGISDGRLGTMVRGWYQDPEDGRRYYLDPLSGIMQTGWQEIAGTWYFLRADGSMATGWIEDQPGKWYYLNPDGSMAAGTVVDGCRLDESGLWIK